jgi:hypothetical protein
MGLTLEELNLIKSHVADANGDKHKGCYNPRCEICKQEQKIYDIIDREIKLKTFDPNKNDKK